MSNKNRHQNKNTPSTRELLVRIVAGFLGFLMIFSILVVAIEAYANTAIDLKIGEEIDVGLFYGSDLAESFTVNTSKGFRLEIPCDDGYLSFDDASEAKVISITAGKNLIKSDGTYVEAAENVNPSIGGYRVMISSYSTKVGGSSKNDNIVFFRPSSATAGSFNKDNIRGYISRIEDTVEKLGSYAFPAYVDGEYYICLGGFATAERAENFLSAFEASYICEGSVVAPDENAYSIIDYQTNTVIGHFKGIDALYVTPVANEIFSSHLGETYYGRLRIKSQKGAFEIVNTLHMEEYVASRLSVEVNTSWNAEALKAAATVVRTNAYSSLDDRSTHKNDGFDYCTNSHCGKYNGCGNVNGNIEKTVDATKNMVIKSGGELINALYGSTYGGATVSLSEAYGEIMAGKGSYLAGQIAAWEDFENRSGGRWKSEISQYELYELLSQRVADCPLKGNVSEIAVLKRSESGLYVTEIEFTDIFGNKLAVTGSETIRNLLSGTLKSANFVVGVAGSEVTEITPKYNSETKETTKTETTVKLDGTYGNFVFVGRGVGSGLGLSLNGVNDLASKGYSYENAYVDMIRIYYKDTTVEQIVTSDGAI